MWSKTRTVLLNLLVLIVLLGGVELYFCLVKPAPDAINVANGLGLRVVPYLMFANPPHTHYSAWTNVFTNETLAADITTNNEGFNERRPFSFVERYRKASNERVVLFTGGSTAWGVGSRSVDTTVAGRMEHYLNALQKEIGRAH